MNWTEIKVGVPVESTDQAAAIANMTVPYGIYIEDYSDLEEQALEIAHIDLIDEELVKNDRTRSVIHIYISECDNAAEAVTFLTEHLAAAGIDAEVESNDTDDSDWNENWKKYFKAFDVGERLAVCPSWETYDNRDGRTVINLDPGAAFGTGTHATTSLCMEILEKNVTDTSTVLDVGTGSGILSIAALLLGAKSAIGVDIDAQSVRVAQENAVINGVVDRAQFVVGDLAEKIDGKYDIVCANIVADVVIRLFENVADFMNDSGILIVSGIIDMRAGDVETAAAAHGFVLKEKLMREEWCAYILTK